MKYASDNNLDSERKINVNINKMKKNKENLFKMAQDYGMIIEPPIQSSKPKISIVEPEQKEEEVQNKASKQDLLEEIVSKGYVNEKGKIVTIKSRLTYDKLMEIILNNEQMRFQEQKQKELKQQSATKIQSVFRGHNLPMKKKLRKTKELEKDISDIERLFMSTEDVKSQQQRRKYRDVDQLYDQMRISKQKIKNELKEKQDQIDQLAIKKQGMLKADVHNQLKENKQKQQSAAQIQKVFRGHMKENQQKQQSAIQIQKVARGYNQLKENKQKQQSATQIQRAFTGQKEILINKLIDDDYYRLVRDIDNKESEEKIRNILSKKSLKDIKNVVSENNKQASKSIGTKQYQKAKELEVKRIEEVKRQKAEKLMKGFVDKKRRKIVKDSLSDIVDKIEQKETIAKQAEEPEAQPEAQPQVKPLTNNERSMLIDKIFKYSVTFKSEDKNGKQISKTGVLHKGEHVNKTNMKDKKQFTDQQLYDMYFTFKPDEKEKPKKKGKK